MFAKRPKQSFYDINKQIGNKFPDYDTATFEMARSTIRGPEYTNNRYKNDLINPNRVGVTKM